VLIRGALLVRAHTGRAAPTKNPAEVFRDPLDAEVERTVHHWRATILAGLPEYRAAIKQAWQ
jgi:hypothetical protein